MKSKRQIAILDIIKNEEISTQEELTEKLIKSGFKVTQATVSRDIKELKLIKVHSDKKGNKYSHVSNEFSKTKNESSAKLSTIISEEDIIKKYTEISKNTCVKCGNPATYMTTWGYIAPWCDECEVKRFAF